MQFVWLDAFTMPVNNPRNIFLMNLKIIFYYFLFIKYLWISKISLISIGLKSTEKKFIVPFNSVFFILLTVNSFEILPKHSV